MRSIGTSSASAAICANTVSTPCPTDDVPMKTEIVPSSLISIRAVSFGPAAPPSMKQTDAEAVIFAVDQLALEF